MDEPATEAVDLCRRCTAPLRLEARFCSACGVPVVEPEPPPPAPPPIDRWAELRAALQLWVGLVVCCGGLGMIHNLTDSDSPILDLVGTIAMAIIVVAFVAASPDKIRDLLSPRRLSRSILLYSAAICAALLVFIHLYVAALSSLGFTYLRETGSFETYGWPVWAMFALVAVCPAVFEELAIRGFVYRRLELVGGPREALFVQAAMFSILHLLPSVFISHFVIGLALGWLRQKSQSLLPGMLVHGTYNGALLALDLWA